MAREEAWRMKSPPPPQEFQDSTSSDDDLDVTSDETVNMNRSVTSSWQINVNAAPDIESDWSGSSSPAVDESVEDNFYQYSFISSFILCHTTCGGNTGFKMRFSLSFNCLFNPRQRHCIVYMLFLTLDIC